MPLSQDKARTIVNAAQAHAQTLGIAVTVAVVDEGGLVKALDRMDGAPPLSAQIAEAKAQGATVWHRDGHAAGSIVVRDSDGAVLGAVGVSGGTPDQDRSCCEAGIEALSG